MQNNKLKILVITDRYPPCSHGGYEIKCQETMGGLSEYGHSIFILTTKIGANTHMKENNVFRLLETQASTSLINMRSKYLRFQL
jgi:hypothetical protein